LCKPVLAPALGRLAGPLCDDLGTPGWGITGGTPRQARSESRGEYHVGRGAVSRGGGESWLAQLSVRPTGIAPAENGFYAVAPMSFDPVDSLDLITASIPVEKARAGAGQAWYWTSSRQRGLMKDLAQSAGACHRLTKTANASDAVHTAVIMRHEGQPLVPDRLAMRFEGGRGECVVPDRGTSKGTISIGFCAALGGVFAGQCRAGRRSAGRAGYDRTSDPVRRPRGGRQFFWREMIRRHGGVGGQRGSCEKLDAFLPEASKSSRSARRAKPV